MTGVISLLLATLAALPSAETLSPPEAGRLAPPNIVLFLVDDLGWQDVSLPLGREVTAFNRRYRTPNLERLAREGTRFTDAYASAPVCTPTRTSILTGQDPARTRITYWILHRGKDTSRRRPDIAAPPWRLDGLSADDVTLPRLLRHAGYRTIHIGKAHFGAHDTSGADPRRLGFDINVAGHASGGPGSYYGEHHFSVAGREGKLGERDTVWDIPGLERYHGEEIYLTEALAIEARAAIGDAVEAGKPFYLSFCPYAVHAPIQANRRKLADYAGLPRREAAYATMVESVDDALGEILDALETHGVAERTLVVFTSDNGGLSAHARDGVPHTHNAPLRSGKGSAYEGGTRVPAVVRWPGVAAAGSVSSRPIISQDLFPTFLAAAGAAIPAGHPVDGIDLRPLFEGRAPLEFSDRALAWHQPHQWGARGPGIEPFSALRIGARKLIYFHADRRFELYDLAADIGEAHDLARDEPKRLRTLAASLSSLLEARDAQLSIDVATGAPIAGPREAVETWLAAHSHPFERTDWRIRSVSSEQGPGERAAHAIDGDPATIWHTRWQGNVSEHPHQITIDLGRVRNLVGFTYLPRRVGVNGTVSRYRVATSHDGQHFATAAEGEFAGDDRGERQVQFAAPTRARYLRFGALAEVNGKPWASAAEIGILTETPGGE